MTDYTEFYRAGDDDPYDEPDYCPGCGAEYCVCDVCDWCSGTGWTDHSGCDDTPGRYVCRRCGGSGDAP